MARLEEVKRDGSALVVIAQRVAEGESLKQIARAWGVPHGPLLLWIMADDARMTLYRNARVAAGFVQADEALEVADEAHPEDVQVAKLRSDVRRWSASKNAPEFFGERLDIGVQRNLPSEEALLAQLDAILAARPELLEAIQARRRALEKPIGEGVVGEEGIAA